jgi:hypothetical protein
MVSFGILRSWQVFRRGPLANRAFHQLVAKRDQLFRDFTIGRAAPTR